MNIAIISTSLNSGGAERIAGLLSKELEKKYNVYLFLLSTENIIYEYGGTLVNIGKCGPFYEYPIKKYKEKYKIDVAISFLEYMNFANVRTRGKERVIVSERSVQSLIDPSLDAQTQKIKRYYPWADEIVACSKGVEYDLKYNYGINSNITTIYNLINKERIQLLAKENIPSDDEKFISNSNYFINIGRLHKQKNQRRLIKQFSIFHRNNKDVKLLIVGSGELESELKELIVKENLTDYVRIIQYTKNPFAYIAKAEAVIVSSHYEGLPNSVLETMLIGKPIISTDCLAGPRELLTDMHDYEVKLEPITFGTRGILTVDSQEEDNLLTTYMAEAMDILHRDYDLRQLMIKNQYTYMENYTNEQILKLWTEVIEKKDRNNHDVLQDEYGYLSSNRKTYIYGAGFVGLSIYFRLKDKVTIDGFVVTKKDIFLKEKFDIPIYQLDDLQVSNDDVQFIMGVGDNSQDDVIKSLKAKGYSQIVYPFILPYGYDFYLNNKIDLKKEVTEWYQIYTGKKIDIDHPITFNEKIQWLKIYDCLPIKTVLADKIAVRNYVAKKIGKKYLIPLIGIWNCYDEIDFNNLPNEFALKCNTGSGTNIIVKDKSKLNHEENKRKFDDWQTTKYEFQSGLEMHYAGIEPKILAEKLLHSEDGNDIKDYKLFVFDGKVKLIQVDIDRQHNHKRNLYTPNWKYLPYSILYPTAPDIEVEEPECLDELISVAERLGEEFIHVRVDFYICNNKIYFGELTFTHGSGTEPFNPPEFEIEMGSWINIEGKR